MAATTVTTSTVATTTVAISGAVFRGRTVVCVAYVALPIPSLVRVKVGRTATCIGPLEPW